MLLKLFQRQNKTKERTTRDKQAIETNANSIHNGLKDALSVEGSSEVTLFRKEEYPIEAINSSFIAFDVETTGLNFDDRVIEVAAVLFENGVPTKYYSSLVNPGISISESATEVNHITDEMLIEAPLPKDVYPSLLDFFGDKILVAYNAAFDMSFLKRELKILNLGFCCEYYDVYEFVKRYYRANISNRKLVTVAESMGIGIEHAHRSYYDAEACGKVLINIYPWIERSKIIDRQNEAIYIRNRTPSDEQKEFAAIINDLLFKNDGYIYLVRYKVYMNYLFLHCRKEEIKFIFTNKGIEVTIPRKYSIIDESFIVNETRTDVTLLFKNPFDVCIIKEYILDVTNKVGQKYEQYSDAYATKVDEEIDNSGFEIKRSEVIELIDSARKKIEEREKEPDNEEIKKATEQLLSDEEAEICAHIWKIFKDNKINRRWLYCEKFQSKRKIEVQYCTFYYPLFEFKISRTGYYFYIYHSELTDEINSLLESIKPRIEHCPPSEGSQHLRVFFDDPTELYSYAPLLIARYERSYKSRYSVTIKQRERVIREHFHIEDENIEGLLTNAQERLKKKKAIEEQALQKKQEKKLKLEQKEIAEKSKSQKKSNYPNE